MIIGTMSSASSLSARSLAIVCAATLALSGCGRGESPATEQAGTFENPTASPTDVDPTASPTDVDPTIPIAPSPAAGIPTAAPQPGTTPDPTTLAASVLITLATVDPDTGGLLMGGYVSGVAEDGGDCQYVVTPATGAAFTIHKDGVENNGSTSCGSTTVSKSLAPAGSYTVTLRYANDKGEVTSDAVKVVLP